MSIYDAIELKVTSVDLLTTLDGKSKTSSKNREVTIIEFYEFYFCSNAKNADSITEAMFKKSVLGYFTAYGVRPNSEFENHLKNSVIVN